MMTLKSVACAIHRNDPKDDRRLFHHQRLPHDRKHTLDGSPSRIDQISIEYGAQGLLRRPKRTPCLAGKDLDNLVN